MDTTPNSSSRGLITNCLYINLDERIDRLVHIKRQLQRIGITGEKMKAVKHKVGAMGCTMSHIKCIELAKSRNWEYVFVCEDDIVFTDPDSLLNSLKKFSQENIDWDVLIVGGNNFPPFQKVNNNCIKISKCQTTTGYIVKRHYYDTLLNNFKQGLLGLIRNPDSKSENAIDIKWMELQNRDNWYMLIPATVSQREDYSDIESKRVNYDYFMLDYEKNWINNNSASSK